MHGSSGGDDSTAVRHKVRVLRWVQCFSATAATQLQVPNSDEVRPSNRRTVLCLLGPTSAKLHTMSDAVIAPSQTSPKTTTKKMTIRQMITSFHEARHIGDVGENDRKRASFQLLGILGFCHFDCHVNFAYSSHSLFQGGGGGRRRCITPLQTNAEP